MLDYSLKSYPLKIKLDITLSALFVLFGFALSEKLSKAYLVEQIRKAQKKKTTKNIQAIYLHHYSQE